MSITNNVPGTDDIAEKPVLLSDVFLLKTTVHKTVHKDLKFHYKSYRIRSRTSDLQLWPKPNTKAISSKKSLAEMMTSGYVIKEQAKKGIIPVITSPNQSRKEQLLKVHFGPMLDNRSQPTLSGQSLKAGFVHNQFRLKESQDYNDPRLSNIWLPNAIV